MKNNNTRKQGDIGVSSAIYYFTSIGNIVSLPLTEASKYDLLRDDGEKILRVQCKTSRYMNKGRSAYQVVLKTAGGNRSWGGVISNLSSAYCDEVFVLTGDGRMFNIPISVLDGRGAIAISGTILQYEVFPAHLG